MLTVLGGGDLLGQQWPKRMFTEFEHDFGSVQYGETPTYRFEIENPFNETIHIQSIRSSCGCTVASATKQTLKTWEKGEIVCKFNTPAVGPGPKQATVTIRFDRPVVAEAQLTIRGNIVNQISVVPPSIDFGQVTENKYPVKKISLSSAGNPELRIQDVKSTFGHISVQLQETMRSNGMVNYDIFTQLKDSVPQGFSQGELYLVVSEGRNVDGTLRLRNVPVKFNAQVVSSLQVSPEVLSLGPLAPGEVATKKVFLKSDQPFKIRDVRCLSDAFRVKADPEAKKVHIVEVTYKGEDDPGRHECDLSFFVEYPDATNTATNGAASTNSMKAIVEIVQN
ncbi:MAG: DUF1573 domain-containing protein [Planctomycetota bacterium]